MANADLRMFMDDLKKIIHGNHHPLLINKNPFILSKMPQFQMLYQELDSIVQTLFRIHEDHLHQLHDLEKVRDLKKRFKDVVEEAQDSIDLFLSALHFINNGVSPASDVPNTSLNRFLSALHFTNNGVSPTSDVPNTPLNRFLSALHFTNNGVSPTSNAPNTSLDLFLPALHFSNSSLNLEKVLKSIEFIKVELMTINIANMKTDSSSRIAHVKTQSVAAEARNHPKKFVQQGLDEASDSQLREMLHKKLNGRRYLIVIDDIWSIESWDELKMFFPRNNTASRILLTSRLNEVAMHVKPHGFVHSLPCLTEEESWELLKQKVFHGDECPEWLIKPGMQIAKK
ncbi:hypothetical protein OSB04_016095 [Centaurea solstitialis]|uniref:NB-ARC domain-containing protein n=1 Tax=Centaurea solstitialis TaxID=347529 RepID=A0AA38WH45_9ASTR|nr:hypothetical protein OSB04_016095 [Centaurea solstitialis]